MKRVIVGVFIVVLCFAGWFIITIRSNVNYEEKMIKDIKNNYVVDDIMYANMDSNYYVILDKSNVIVLDMNFDEVLKDDKRKLVNMDGEYEIVYKQNKLKYEKKKFSKNKISYIYYDAYTGNEENTVSLGG